MEKAVRRTLNLPRMTGSKLIHLLAGNCSFQEQHERRCGALYASMMQSDNNYVGALYGTKNVSAV